MFDAVTIIYTLKLNIYILMCYNACVKVTKNIFKFYTFYVCLTIITILYYKVTELLCRIEPGNVGLFQVLTCTTINIFSS